MPVELLVEMLVPVGHEGFKAERPPHLSDVYLVSPPEGFPRGGGDGGDTPQGLSQRRNPAGKLCLSWVLFRGRCLGIGV